MSQVSVLNFLDSNTRTGIKSDTYYIPNPSEYKVLMADLDLDDKRSTSGYLNRHRIRRNVYSVICTWERLTADQLYWLLNACQAAKFRLRFIDPYNLDSGLTTKDEMYADANKEAELITYDADDSSETFWKISLTFVEF